MRARKLTARILVRCKPEEKAAFEEAAELEGTTLSEWSRALLRKDAERILKRRGRPIAFIDVTVKRKAKDGKQSIESGAQLAPGDDTPRDC
ncbi:MAG: DUF1778 domain-containing protein [Rhodomicrobium sp.]|jgi:uncharacterized protein (DUF1778 family)